MPAFLASCNCFFFWRLLNSWKHFTSSGFFLPFENVKIYFITNTKLRFHLKKKPASSEQELSIVNILHHSNELIICHKWFWLDQWKLILISKGYCSFRRFKKKKLFNWKCFAPPARNPRSVPDLGDKFKIREIIEKLIESKGSSCLAKPKRWTVQLHQATLMTVYLNW